MKDYVRKMRNPAQRYLLADYETRSEVDLRAGGSYEYAAHPSTEILCLAWRWAERRDLLETKTTCVSLFDDPPELEEFARALSDPETIVVAHNSGFENVITHHVLRRWTDSRGRALSFPDVPIERWLCTASLAAALALPRALEGAGQAMGLDVKKDMDGRRLLLRMCKPRRETKHDKSRWHAPEEAVTRLMAYCATDVAAETELFLKLPPLNPLEREVWELDQRVNLRGFQVDRDLVTMAVPLIEQEGAELNAELCRLTDGAVERVTQVARCLAWLEGQGVFVPDLTAQTVSDALKAGLATGAPQRVLEIRQALAKSSTAKYEAFIHRSGTDGRCRDNLLYHGASTGRWSGVGVQPQNFPRGTIKDTEPAIRAIKSGDLELVRLLYGNPMNVFANCLRGAIVARPGAELFCADYAAIEARVVFWLANHTAGLEGFRNGTPFYEQMAARIYDLPIEDVKNPSPERDLGKRSFLGNQYGQGAKRFRESSAEQGQEITEELAKTAVDVYREMHRPVVLLWGIYERIALAAVSEPGRRFSTHYTTWFMQGRFLFAELPSGRRLAYADPVIRQTMTSWGEMRPTLHHMGIDQKTKQWVLQPKWGGVWVENITSAIARDLLVAAMLRTEAAGYETVLSVHDELLAEREKGQGSVKEFQDLMMVLPPWAEGLPVKAVGFSANRYRK